MARKAEMTLGSAGLTAHATTYVLDSTGPRLASELVRRRFQENPIPEPDSPRVFQIIKAEMLLILIGWSWSLNCM
jgi:hypothetical protein